MITKHGGWLLPVSSQVRHLNLNVTISSLRTNDLLSHCKHGSLHEAIGALEVLVEQNVPVSTELLICVTKKCEKGSDLAIARRLHSILSCKKCSPPTLFADNLIRLFTTCGSLADANHVFLTVSKPSIFTWTEIVLAHAKLGVGHIAIKLYRDIPWGVVKPDKHLLTLILRVSSNIGDLDHGKLVHYQITAMKISSDIGIDNALVCMYAKCGSFDNAFRVFDTLRKRDATTWSAIIVGCSQCGHSSLALDFFQNMEEQGVQVDRVAFLCVLKACNVLCEGMFIHSCILHHHLESDITISNALVDMYAKRGHLQEALKVFDSVSSKDMILWSCILAGCADLKQDDLVFELFEQMLAERVEPTEFTFASVLKACSNARNLEKGRSMHDMVERRGFTFDVIVGNSLVDMYMKCGTLSDGLRMFEQMAIRNIASWGIIINACADKGCGKTALQIYNNFKETNLSPDDVLFLGVLKACSDMGDLLQGREIHSDIVKCGFMENVSISNTVVDMYFKCTSIEEALNVFDDLSCRTIVSWSAVLAGYNQQQHWTKALDLFSRVLMEELNLDQVLFLHILEACGNVRSMGLCMLIHDQIVRHNLESSQELGSALLDTYCRCGCWNEGHRVFKQLLGKDIVVWGAMIGGLVHGGHWSLAKECLLEMRQQRMQPNMELYVCVLIACSSAGLTEKGRCYFNALKEVHADAAESDHLSCMADLLGRVGLLKELKDFVQTMPVPPNEVLCTSLLDICRTYRSIFAVGWPAQPA